MKIIAFGHRAATGKDTLAGFLATQLRLNNRKLNIQVVGFADELKDVCYRLYAWAGMKRKEHYEQYPNDKNVMLVPLNKTVRTVWIEVGNHMREYDKNVWIKAMLNKPDIDILIIKDARYLNEIEAIIEHNGVTVKVVRDSVPVLDDVTDNALADYTGWDLVVENNGTLNQLNDWAGKLITRFKL